MTDKLHICPSPKECPKNSNAEIERASAHIWGNKQKKIFDLPVVVSAGALELKTSVKSKGEPTRE